MESAAASFVTISSSLSALSPKTYAGGTRSFPRPAMRKILLTGVAVLIGSVKARDLDVSVMPLAAGRIG